MFSQLIESGKLAAFLEALLHLDSEVFHCTLMAAVNHLDQRLTGSLWRRRWGWCLGAESGAGEKDEDNKDSSAK